MPASTLRVLVLEAQSLKSSALVGMLRQLGCHAIHEVKTVAEAVTSLRQVGAIDILICDIHSEGFDAVCKLRRVGQVGAVVLSSSLPEKLDNTARQIITQLGLGYLGDIGGLARIEPLSECIHQYIAEAMLKTPVERVVPGFAERELLQAFANKEMVAYFQPQICLSTGALYGVEVLVRWLHPTLGIMLPGLFLATLHQHGLMDELFFELLEQSLKLHAHARHGGQTLKISLNIQPSQLERAGLVMRLQQALLRHKVMPSDITLELVESESLQLSERLLGALLKLRVMGCNLAVDDFGMGYSSLQRLCQLPFTEIKVDGSFVRNAQEDIRCTAVIRSALLIGNELGLPVIVEGIETLGQARHLMALGCQFGQGYLMAKPMSGPAFLQWLKGVDQSLGRVGDQKLTGWASNC
ncbi:MULTISPECIES: EAL domain-containing response regulator [Pseudomonas]|jgi:EAL domain-containing protein (putative c-di-GMP-specific phosphodiesterase class I)/DNA-binding NarL/FixJ family response regulator|uniref:EAL domain-containing response regulator n=1 Tax=Pseudomonas TaxID=286 RepID=UPI00099B688E|nr:MULTISPECIES: EAL domain-containing response regulator [Pseudomonas]MCK3838861.1 EAL domain-containing protein [Pseudomonas sp. NCIMB 10586]VCU67870.1 Phytochrome-like protein cph2 [Pseudomonas synxantha]